MNWSTIGGRRGAAGLMAGTALALSLAFPVQARESAVEPEQLAQAGDRRIRFDIAAQPLPQALNAFGRQAGVQVTGAAAVTSGVQAQAVSGDYTVGDALMRLLSGTGITFSFSDDRTVILEKVAADGAMTLDPVNVEGSAGARILPTEGTGAYTTEATKAATRLPLALKETPQSVTVVTRQRMEDQQLDSLGEVLMQTTGIQVVGSDSERDEWYSRGFYINKILTDGMPTDIAFGGGYGETNASTAIYDRVEVVRGATGLMSGAGDPSASVNLVRKRASGKEARAIAEIGLGSWENYSAMVDASAPVVADGTVRARFVAERRDTGSFIDRYDSTRHAFLGTMEMDLTPNTVLVAGADYRDSSTDNSTYGALPQIYSDGTATDFSRSASIAPDWAYWQSRSYTAFTTIEHQFDNKWSVDAGLSLRKSKFDAKGLYIYGIEADTYEGMYTRLGKFGEENETLAYEANVSGPVQVLGRMHELVFGTNGSRSESDGFEQIQYPDAAATPGNVFDWTDGSYPEPSWSPSTYDGKTMQRGYYGAAKLALAEPLKLVIGGRYSTWENSGTYDGAVNETRSFDALTPYGGIIYDIDDTYSAYVSYTGIFNPQDYKDRNGTYLDPIKGKNYEVGIKAGYMGGRLNASLAGFKTLQDNVAEADVGYFVPGSFDQAYVGAKGVTTKGVDAEVSGEVTPGWNVSLGYSVSYSRDADGNDVVRYLPSRTARLFTTYRLPGAWSGLIIGGGGYWQSSTYEAIWTGAEEVDVESSDYVVANLMAKYALTPSSSVQLNLNNLFDKTYTNGTGSYGSPRNFLLTLRTEW